MRKCILSIFLVLFNERSYRWPLKNIVHQKNTTNLTVYFPAMPYLGVLSTRILGPACSSLRCLVAQKIHLLYYLTKQDDSYVTDLDNFKRYVVVGKYPIWLGQIRRAGNAHQRSVFPEEERLLAHHAT